jgi:RNA polymerase sigma factor (sigma-70 family)
VEIVAQIREEVDVVGLIEARLHDSLRLATGILLDQGDAEEAVQDASLIAWRRQRSLRDPARFEVWFERILVNQCRDRLRKRRRAVQIAAPRIGFDLESQPAETGIDEDVERALVALDVDHRIVVVMRFWQDRTVDDIAARLQIPAGTVKSRLHHALKTLRMTLEVNHGRA